MLMWLFCVSVILRVFLLFFLMKRRPPRSTRTDTLFPFTTRFRSDRWLGILSESQIAVWSFTHNTEEMLAQRIINFLKNLPCGGTGFCKRLAHTIGRAHV